MKTLYVINRFWNALSNSVDNSNTVPCFYTHRSFASLYTKTPTKTVCDFFRILSPLLELQPAASLCVAENPNRRTYGEMCWKKLELNYFCFGPSWSLRDQFTAQNSFCFRNEFCPQQRILLTAIKLAFSPVIQHYFENVLVSRITILLILKSPVAALIPVPGECTCSLRSKRFRVVFQR